MSKSHVMYALGIIGEPASHRALIDFGLVLIFLVLAWRAAVRGEADVATWMGVCAGMRLELFRQHL